VGATCSCCLTRQTWRGFSLKRHQFQRVNIEFETVPALAQRWCDGCLCVQRLVQGPAEVAGSLIESAWTLVLVFPGSGTPAVLGGSPSWIWNREECSSCEGLLWLASLLVFVMCRLR
jgi:hypothetical protein